MQSITYNVIEMLDYTYNSKKKKTTWKNKSDLEYSLSSINGNFI